MSTTSTSPSSASKTRASYSVDYGCDPPNVSKARALIVRDLNAMRTADVSDSELHQAKALLAPLHSPRRVQRGSDRRRLARPRPDRPAPR